MNLIKYILISLMIHVLVLFFLSGKRVPSVSLGMHQGGISLSFQQGSGERGNSAVSSIHGDGQDFLQPGENATGSGTGGSFTVSRMVADAYANNPPEYPRIARAMGYQGTVTIELEVLPDGTCGNVTLAKSSGHRILDIAALRAASGWIFFRDKAVNLVSPVRVSQDIVFILNTY